jgi:hypothetical protein
MRHGADHIIYFDEQLINVGTRMVAQKADDAYLFCSFAARGLLLSASAAYWYYNLV